MDSSSGDVWSDAVVDAVECSAGDVSGGVYESNSSGASDCMESYEAVA